MFALKVLCATLLFAPAVMFLYKRNASGSVLSLHRCLFRTPAEGHGLLLSTSSVDVHGSVKGCPKRPAAGQAELCVHARHISAGARFPAPSAAWQVLPAGQSLDCNMVVGPAEKGSSALTYGMWYIGSLLGNPVCEQSPVFVPNNNHRRWDGW